MPTHTYTSYGRMRPTFFRRTPQRDRADDSRGGVVSFPLLFPYLRAVFRHVEPQFVFDFKPKRDTSYVKRLEKTHNTVPIMPSTRATNSAEVA